MNYRDKYFPILFGVNIFASIVIACIYSFMNVDAFSFLFFDKCVIRILDQDHGVGVLSSQKFL
jgi:hypothetical protein